MLRMDEMERTSENSKEHEDEENRVPPPGCDISSFNWSCTETGRIQNGPEVLIELPVPKHCTSAIPLHSSFLMNGCSGGDGSQENKLVIMESQEEDFRAQEETKPFLNHHSPRHFSDCINKIPISVPSCSTLAASTATSTTISSSMFPLLHPSSNNSIDSAESSLTESDVEVEPESSTHLLRGEEQQKDVPSPKIVKSKTKLAKTSPNFRSSPKKPLIDTHPHIHHRPLGSHAPTNTFPSHIFILKWNWSVARFACLILVVSSLIGLTCLVVGVMISRPMTCEPGHQWWQGTVMYEIFPASFQDTDGDGFGDIRGVLRRLDYIRELNIDVIRMNSIYSALDYPLEYEHVIDFSNVDPHLGRMDDFEQVVKELHAHGMYIVLDMNPTVTSDQHTWAAHWLLHRPGRYEDFYVNVTELWEEPPLESPNDYDDRDWTVPHRTFGSQLYLNWSNPLVQMEMKEVLEFWLEQGVDGFFMKHIENLHVADDTELITILHQWRYLLDRFSNNSSRKILIASQTSFQSLQTRGDPSKLASILPLFDMVDVRLNIAVNRTEDIKEQITEAKKWTAQFPVSPWISWHVGSVETPRLATRLGDRYTLGAMFLLMMLPGSLSLFYGDEVGMQDSFDIFSNKVFRGGQLCPMQWTSAPYGNFTVNDSLPWLPLHPNFPDVNVENRSETVALISQLVALKNGSLPASTPHHSLVRSLVARMQRGHGEPVEEPNYRLLGATHSGVVALERSYSLHQRFLVCANFGEGTARLRLQTEEEEGDQQQLAEDVRDEGGSEDGERQVTIVISTNSRRSGRAALKDVILDVGEAFIGRLST